MLSTSQREDEQGVKFQGRFSLFYLHKYFRNLEIDTSKNLINVWTVINTSKVTQYETGLKHTAALLFYYSQGTLFDMYLWPHKVFLPKNSKL